MLMAEGQGGIGGEECQTMMVNRACKALRGEKEMGDEALAEEASGCFIFQMGETCIVSIRGCPAPVHRFW